MTPTYDIAVSWDADEKIWIADVPDLPYCTAHGPTPHDAVAEVEQAVGAWIEAARASGREVPAPGSRALRA